MTETKKNETKKTRGPRRSHEEIAADYDKRAKAAAQKPVVRLRDAATGSTWSGRGLQPRWLKVALDGGRTLAEFDMAAGNGPSTAPSTAPAAAPILSAAAADPFRVL